MTRTVGTIAVDLTPVLPGGENGGAKIFAMEIVRTLAAMHPDTRFLLLTQAASHDELASLESANVQRRVVVGIGRAGTMRPRLEEEARRVLRRLPARFRQRAMGLGYRLNQALKRSGSRSLLRGAGVDLLYCPFTAPTYAEQGIPAVCTVYDLQHRTYPQFFEPEDAAYRDHVFRDACRRAGVIAAISDYTREAVVHHCDIDPARVRTIYLRMAQRIPARPGEHTALLVRLGLRAGRYLVYPANFWKHKNHETLLTAFGMAASTGLAADIKLVCTGTPGERQAWLTRAAAAMDLGERVIFPGFLEDGELAGVLADARGMVFPSLYEGFGLPVLEAMAAGIPVACSNLTALPEVASGAALLFDPRVPSRMAEAIIAVTSDEPVRSRLISAGIERAKTFTDPARMAGEYWELFGYALRGPR